MKQKVTALLKESMKAKTANKTEVYRAILTAFMTAEKEGGHEYLADAEYTAILRKMVKVRKETALVYVANKRDDLALQEGFEATVIEELLPQLLTGVAAENYVLNYVALHEEELTKPNMGRLVKEIVADADGKLDGKTVSTIIIKHLK